MRRRRIHRHAADRAASALRRVDAALSVALAHSAAAQLRLVGPPAPRPCFVCGEPATATPSHTATCAYHERAWAGPRVRVAYHVVIPTIDGETVEDTARRMLDTARRNGWTG